MISVAPGAARAGGPRAGGPRGGVPPARLSPDGLELGAEHGGERGPGRAVGGREHLAQHAGELFGHFAGRAEPPVRVGVGGPAQQPGERLLLLEQRHPVREGELGTALVALELEGEHGQRPRHREQIRRHRRPVGPDLGRLVADGPVDGLVAVDPAHAAHVDELELLLGLDDVVRLEVAVHQSVVVQVTQRGQHLDGVRDRVRQRHRAAVAPRVLQDLLERLAAHVLHHDVPGRLPRPPVRVLDEVVDADDVRVFHLGEELALGDRGRHGVRVPGVQQALKHHPAVADVAVAGQVDPAEPAEGEAAEHLVLPRHQITRLQLRAEREPGAAVAAEAFGQPGAPVPAAPDGLIAAGAEAPVLRDLRVGEYGAGRVTVGHRRDLDQPRAEPPPRRPATGPPGPPGARGPAAGPRSRAHGPRADRSGGGGRGRGGGEAADVAVSVLDRPAAARAGAHRHRAPLVSPVIGQPAYWAGGGAGAGPPIQCV